MLLEYRNLEVESPYQKDGSRFSIPENVFLIGTMNTTDRSLAQMTMHFGDASSSIDYRPWSVMKPPFPLARGADLGRSGPKASRATTLQNLNSRVRKELGEHFQIGHSYFMSSDAMTDSGRKRIWEHAVIPHLEEYFYNRRDRDDLLVEFGLERRALLTVPHRIPMTEILKTHEYTPWEGSLEEQDWAL